MTEQRALPTNAVEALHATKAVLQQQGRTKKISFTSDGRVCLAAAVCVAVGTHSPIGVELTHAREQEQLYTQTMASLGTTAQTRTGQRFVDAIDFNDRPLTTDEDVYGLIDETIARLEANNTEEN